MRTIWFVFFLLVVAIGGGFVFLGPDPMYQLFLKAGRAVAPTVFVEDHAPKPEETLIAPFAEPSNMTKPGAKAALPVNAIPIDQPHRTADEIGAWLTTSVSTALSFDRANFVESQKKISLYFTPEGLASYRAFLEASGYRARITDAGESLGNFIQENPFLLNKGAVDGAYHWLFEVPVMISFLPSGQRDARTQTTRNEEILVNVDVVRVQETSGEAIRIYNWSVKLKSSQ